MLFQLKNRVRKHKRLFTNVETKRLYNNEMINKKIYCAVCVWRLNTVEFKALFVYKYTKKYKF